MRTARIVSQLHSDDFHAINQWFQANRPPYGLHDIFRFNALYRQAYPALSREEKRRIEEFVDMMIAGVADRRLIPKIFGVV